MDLNFWILGLAPRNQKKREGKIGGEEEMWLKEEERRGKREKA